MKQSTKIIIPIICLAVLLAIPTIGWLRSGKTWYCGPEDNPRAVKATLVNGTLRISGKGAMRNYETVAGNPPPWKVQPRPLITDLVIEEGVTYIGDEAFDFLKALKSVTILGGVMAIKDDTFYACTSLTSVTIPNSVTTIGEKAFPFNRNLTSIEVAKDNIHYSSEDGVLFNKNKTELILYPGGKRGTYTIPSSVTTIGKCAFRLHLNLTSVIIPNSVTSIGEDTFFGCCNLTSINVAEDNTHYSSEDGILFDKNKTTLIFYPRTRQGAYKIPNSVTAIGNRAFLLHRNLSSVTFPSNMMSIGKKAFDYCNKLTSIISLNPVPPDIGSATILGLPSNVCLYVPTGSIDAYRVADVWKEFNCIKTIAEAGDL